MKFSIRTVKYSVLALIVLSLIGIFMLFGYFAAKSSRKASRFRDANEAFIRKDYKQAKDLLRIVLANDNNNERATELLAEIAGIEGRLPEELYYRSRLIRLNALNAEYARTYERVLFRLNAYDSLRASVEKITEGTRNNIQHLHFIYAEYNLGHDQVANAYWDRYVKGKSALEAHPLAQYISAIYRSPNATVAETVAKLKELATGKDSDVALVAMIDLSRLEYGLGNIANAEMWLKNAVPLNRYIALTALARFYADERNFQAASDTLDGYLKDFPNPDYAVMQTELYALLEQPDKIRALHSVFQKRTERFSILACYYMNAVLAFMKEDYAGADEALAPTRSQIITQYSRLLSIYIDTRNSRPIEALSDYKDLMRLAPFLDFRDRARNALLAYVAQCLEKENYAVGVLELADYLNQEKAELPLTRFVAMGHFVNNTLSAIELNQMFANYPNDPFLIRIAAEFYYRIGESQRALGMLNLMRKNNDTPTGELQLLEAVLLTRLKRYDDASMRFHAILKENPSAVNQRAYWDFCVLTSRKADFEFLGALPEAKEYVVPCKAEALLCDGKIQEAMALYADYTSKLPQMLFHAASRLGTYDFIDDAIECYSALPEDFAREYVLINLSELYAAKHDDTNAMQSAVDAYALAPASPDVQLCYARRLHDAKQDSRIPDVFRLETTKRGGVSNDSLALWITGMEALIRDLYDAGKKESVRERCRQLLIYAPRNAVANEFLAKTEPKKP